jgi:hypothetical protein
MFPLLRVEKGFQRIGRSGPGYMDEIVRPVRALHLLGKPRLFLVCGEWDLGCFNSYHVAKGTDFLEPREESDITYLSDTSATDPYQLPDWDEAVARRAEPRPPSEEPKDAYDFLMEANGWINSAYYSFIGRASNDEVFRGDDLDPIAGLEPQSEQQQDELNLLLRQLWEGGETVSLIERMIAHLNYLRDVYSADRGTIKAWRQERIQAHDAMSRLRGDYSAYQASPEFKRWQAIRNIGALDYVLNSQKRVEQTEEQSERIAPTPAPTTH